MIYVLTGLLLSVGIYINFSKICLAAFYTFIYFENIYKDTFMITKITYFDYDSLNKLEHPVNKKMIAVVQHKHKKQYIECFNKQDINKLNMNTDFRFAAAEIKPQPEDNNYEVCEILNNYFPDGNVFVFNNKFAEICVFLKTDRTCLTGDKQYAWSLISSMGKIMISNTHSHELQYDIKHKLLEYKE